MLFARWTSDFDCGYETPWYVCIMDRVFDITKLNSKKRYEINRGNKNFYTSRLSVEDIGLMYNVYIDSLAGYKKVPKIQSEESFKKDWEQAIMDKDTLLLGCFDKQTNVLCGYAHCIFHGRYIPISTFKTNPKMEKRGVNFALMDGICKFYEKDIENGSYLCDGYRNVLHQTNFQNWLEKYFLFRKAYCKLNIIYKPYIKVVINFLYPFRNLISKILPYSNVNGMLKMENFRRGCNIVQKEKTTSST